MQSCDNLCTMGCIVVGDIIILNGEQSLLTLWTKQSTIFYVYSTCFPGKFSIYYNHAKTFYIKWSWTFGSNNYKKVFFHMSKYLVVQSKIVRNMVTSSLACMIVFRKSRNPSPLLVSPSCPYAKKSRL